MVAHYMRVDTQKSSTYILLIIIPGGDRWLFINSTVFVECIKKIV